MCNNSTAVSYITKEGMIKLYKLTQLAVWFLRVRNWMGIQLVPVHLSRVRIVRAGALSHVVQTTLSELGHTGEASCPCVCWMGQTWDRSVCYFSCDQAALRTLLSVRPSVCLSVTPFSQCSSYHIIMKFSGAITTDRSNVHAKEQGQRSKVMVTEVKPQLNRFRTETPVWIHVWWWNDAQSLMLLRGGAVLFFKVTWLKKSSILTQIGRFWTVTPVWIHQWLRNYAQSLK